MFRTLYVIQKIVILPIIKWKHLLFKIELIIFLFRIFRMIPNRKWKKKLSPSPEQRRPFSHHCSYRKKKLHETPFHKENNCTDQLHPQNSKTEILNKTTET